MTAPVHSAGRWCLASWRSVRLGYQRLHQTQASGRETHFGFQTVSEEEKGERVYHVFESVAKNYDVMNDSMSLGIHRLWKDWLIRHMKPTPGTQLLDVAGGTGDVSFRFINYIRAQREKLYRDKLDSQETLSWSDISKSYSNKDQGSLMGSHAVICDINKEMLKVGKEKSLQLGYSEGIGNTNPSENLLIHWGTFIRASIPENPVDTSGRLCLKNSHFTIGCANKIIK
ncbi:hypothetical protein GDO81_002141 [Engystomops pustulosus]|uniref:2-methoxy-6-polyprenyl-1,4-benzoquinol methylase, mitochondrial n=1 Tax=Engystomops pustulosus TaxID=76066 RepID=A0AAV7DHN2_ENGPU|nr:hypothetical protein GDO81_002141 [Engystomops pustulosus]